MSELESNAESFETITLPGGLASNSGDEYSTMARDLKCGAWVEFGNGDGSRKRARLTGVSPLLCLYEFASREQTITIPMHELAARFRMGKARIIQDVPLTDRIAAMFGRLRRKTEEA
ncbi:MAG: DUF1631 family protein [Burkholderiales bacterium]